MTLIPVTLLYGGLLIVLVTLLGAWVSISRLRTRAWLGKPLPESMHRPMRAHGNAAEWIPFGILALLLLELAHAPPYWLHVCGGAYVLLRVLHAAEVLLKWRFRFVVLIVVAHYLLLLAMGSWVVVLHFA
jgi:uncharacterized protein